jgi:4-alpha-glucanotransferase
VRLIGDVPIYVAAGSADDVRWPELFRDDVVAGVPPDAFTDKGQLWGNPIYDWPALRRRRYRWWVERLRRTFDLFDLARIDHFRGFVAYWAVPERHRTARRGHFEHGPGRALFEVAGRDEGPCGFGEEPRPLL